MIKLIYIIIFLISHNLNARISDITRFPFQDADKVYTEVSPVVISENEILIFYSTANFRTPAREADTLYYSKSADGGMSWGQPVFIKEIGLISFLSSLRTSSGRIILAWSGGINSGITIIYSEDNGLTWSDATVFQTIARNHLVLSELENEKIILSCVVDNSRRVHYAESFDGGKTWSQNAVIFYTGSKEMRTVSFVDIYDKVFAIFEYDNSGIYFKQSTNNGLTWSEAIPIIDSPQREHNPRVLKFSDNSLWIIYQLLDTTNSLNHKNDIYFIKSTNGGITWSSPERFTHYAGEDQFLQTARIGDKPFIAFASTRFTNSFQICYAVIGETIEKFRPPYIRSVSASLDSINRKQWMINAHVFDDEEIVSVTVTLENGFSLELFDDGNHSDGEALDNIYENTFLFDYSPLASNDLIDINNLKLPFNNNGSLADSRLNYRHSSVFTATDYSAEESVLKTLLEGKLIFPAAYKEHSYMHGGGFILSGYSNGSMWSNAAASSILLQDYLPGNVGSDHNDPRNSIYVVYKDEPPFGYSWQRWRDAVALGAPFYDGDGDGIYNPVDKNYNGTWDPNEDMPLLLGDMTAWCIYNDGSPAFHRNWNTIQPQGIEIQQTIFASTQPELENVIFIHYSITNTGTVSDILDSVYFGSWLDVDLGHHLTDIVGCDTLLNSSFYYKAGPDLFYGEDPPAFFNAFLQGPIVNTNNPADTAHSKFGELYGSRKITGSKNLGLSAHVFYPGGFHLPIGQPSGPVQARYNLQGKSSLGNLPDPCTLIHWDVRGGVNCNEINPVFWASGDPVTDYGWLVTLEFDYYNLMSSGPFTLGKNKPQDIIIAFVMGRGTDNLNSITVARDNVRQAIQEYNSNFSSLTYSPPAPTNPVTNYILYQNYPNPFNPTTTIRYELPQDGIVRIDVFNILGQKVRTLVNEHKYADRYEIEFNAAGLSSGVYFYRIQAGDYVETKKMVLIR